MYFKQSNKVPNPGKVTRFVSEGAQCLKTSSEKPPVIIPGVAKRTQGPGALINERSKLRTAKAKSNNKICQHSDYNNNAINNLKQTFSTN